eukprot:2785502-Amphidinium_carterae.1
MPTPMKSTCAVPHAEIGNSTQTYASNVKAMSRSHFFALKTYLNLEATLQEDGKCQAMVKR